MADVPALGADLTKELLELLVDELMDLLGELLSLVGKGLAGRCDLSRDDLEVVLDGLLNLRDGLKDLLVSARLLLGLDNVATTVDDRGVVAATAAVPGQQVGGVLGNIGEGIDGGNADQLALELLGGDGSDGVLRVGGRLQGQVVGQETADVGRGHGSSRDGVNRGLASDPGRLDAQARGEDVSALSVVGEVGTAVVNRRGTDSDGLASGSGRVVTCVRVVVACGDGKVETSVDGSVNSLVEQVGLATTEGHVGDGALEALALAILGSLDLLLVRGSSKVDTSNDIRHCATTIGAENLDCIDVGLLRNTVLLSGDGSRAVCAVAVTILVSITVGDGLAPVSAALEVNVLSVGAGVNDIGVDTLTTVLGIEVFVEGTERKGVAVGDTSQAPWSHLLGLTVTGLLMFILHRVDDGVLLDGLNLSRITLVSKCIIEMTMMGLLLITIVELVAAEAADEAAYEVPDEDGAFSDERSSWELDLHQDVFESPRRWHHQSDRRSP